MEENKDLIIEENTSEEEVVMPDVPAQEEVAETPAPVVEETAEVKEEAPAPKEEPEEDMFGKMEAMTPVEKQEFINKMNQPKPGFGLFILLMNSCFSTGVIASILPNISSSGSGAFGASSFLTSTSGVGASSTVGASGATSIATSSVVSSIIAAASSHVQGSQLQFSHIHLFSSIISSY